MKYIASWSGGKDSTASIILAHEHNEPLDLIIFSEVMFDKNISGELPEHIDFIKNKAFPIFNEWGYETKILRAKLTYMDIFNRYPTRGKRKGLGMKTGFPMAGRCQINRSVKVKPIRDFLQNYPDQFMQYIGIAVDEPIRLERVVRTTNQESLLQKYGYTEKMAYELCDKYGLLSPVYERMLDELLQYRKIGTVEECRKAREKQNQKPLDFYGDSEDGKLLCPNCGNDLWELKECGFNNCPYCGQVIQWNENLEGMEDGTGQV